MKKYLVFLFIAATANVNAESTGTTFVQKNGEVANQASPDGWTISQEGRTGAGNAKDKRISIGTESKYTDKDLGYDIFTGKNVGGSSSATISVGNDSYKRQIKNVENGIDDSDAVNVSQLKGLKTYTDDKTDGIKDTAVKESNTYTDNKTDGIKDAAVKESNTYTDNKTDGIKDTAVKESNTYTDNRISKFNIDGSQTLKEANNYTDRRFNQLDKKIDRGLASAAAMSMLFQPYGVGKLNVTAGIGGYGSETAIAIGSGYRFDENKAIKAGVSSSTSSSSKLTYGASVNFEW